MAPLWRIWPERFSILELWVGALVPDVIDGFENIVIHGELRQWIGHSLLGATLVGVPVALVLAACLRAAIRRVVLRKPGHRGPAKRCAVWLALHDNCRRRAPRIFSAWVGAVSHVIADMITHEHSRLLWPFATDPHWLGSWWSSAWFHVSAPGYPDYPIGPHFIAWVALSIGGAVLFFRWPPRRRTIGY